MSDIKTLIINGSPRPDGNTAKLLEIAKENLVGEIVELSAYYGNFAPCNDCRDCHKKIGCQIKDDFNIITDDDYDNIIIASPIYMGTLTPPMHAIISRFQANFVAKHFLNSPIKYRPKRAIVILVGGGNGNGDEAIRLSKFFCATLNAVLDGGSIVTSLNTDTVPAVEDADAVLRLRASFRATKIAKSS